MIEATAATATPTNTWFPVLTLFLGWAFSQVTEWQKDKRTRLHDKEARDTARRDTLTQKRNEFQRQTLLDLQDAMMSLMQAASSMHFHHRKSFRHKGETPYRYPEDVDLAYQAASAKTAVLGVRVRDTDVRSLLQTLKDHLMAEYVARNDSDSMDAITVAGQVFVALNGRVGSVLRALEDVELAESEK